MPISPTAEGFRAAFRRPLLTFAEITWRWVVGMTATVLLIFGFFEYLDTLPVTNWDVLFLQTRHPLLVWQAIAHIVRGSIGRAVLSLILAALLLTLIWMIAASLGRLATVGAMIEYFRSRFSTTVRADSPGVTPHNSRREIISNLLQLNFLRVALFLAALIGIAGSAIIASFISSAANPHPVLAFVLFVPMAGIISLVGYGLNWLLSLAAVFVVRDAEDAVGAIFSAVALCRERPGSVFAVSTWTSVAHLIALVGASTVVLVPIALAQILPWRLVTLGVFLVTLAYFVLADWLYTVRLAGYVCITDMPESLLAPTPPTSPHPTVQPSTSVDPDELILSDVPYPVTG